MKKTARQVRCLEILKQPFIHQLGCDVVGELRRQLRIFWTQLLKDREQTCRGSALKSVLGHLKCTLGILCGDLSGEGEFELQFAISLTSELRAFRIRERAG